MNLKSQALQSSFLGLAFVTALSLSVPAAQAGDDCQKRIVQADHKLHEAVEHHGWQSSQAEHWRHELAEARAYCWDDHDHDRH